VYAAVRIDRRLAFYKGKRNTTRQRGPMLVFRRISGRSAGALPVALGPGLHSIERWLQSRRSAALRVDRRALEL